ncbi:MAG: deoxyribonuclease IV [Candidatus Buchananbacteria bacterium]|jgi:deoxyribonuclease-4
MDTYPKIGAHISAAGDIALAPVRAHEAGLECFQFFSRPPQGGPAKPITSKLIKEFRANSDKYDLESYIHTPYYINLASAKNNIYFGSIKVIREELERGSMLGVKYIMAHLGSAKELGEKEGVKKVIDGIVQILKDYKGQTEFLIEMSAGAGAIIGDSFEEIAKIVLAPKLKKYNIGICFDTCHGFASGYDLRTAKAVAATFKKFDKILGVKRLKLIHTNDCESDFGSHKDRHAHIGEGNIGLDGFKAIVAIAKKRKINLILETPHDLKLQQDIKILKKIRDRK